MFLDFIKIPLSQDSSNISVEGSGYGNWPEKGDGTGRVGWPGRAAYSCVTSNFGRS